MIAKPTVARNHHRKTWETYPTFFQIKLDGVKGIASFPEVGDLPTGTETTSGSSSNAV
jgi:hypothetical protein